MVWIACVALTTGALALFALAFTVLRRPDPTPPPPAPSVPGPPEWLVGAEHRSLVVHTKDDRSIEGILRLAAVDGLLLWRAKLLGPKDVDLGGEVFVPRDQILFVQTTRR